MGCLVVVAFLALRVFVFQPYRVPAASMLPSLPVGQYFIADRRLGTLSRGDVVVFEFPPDRGVDYVKRIIGLPGEQVEVRGHLVTIDGRPLESTFLEEIEWTDDRCNHAWGTLYQEGDGERSWQILLPPVVRSPLADFGPAQIPADHYFVLGDNRDNSSDSRAWGFVPADHLQARQSFLGVHLDPCAGR